MKFHPWRYVLPLLILWLAFGLRLHHLDFQSIWWDEGHSIFVASQPMLQIPTLPAMDVHPPAYFILLHLWMTITGQSEFALRYLSVIFSLLTVALLWRFATSISSYLASPSHRLLASPFLASLLATFSPMYIAYAQEVRSYAMITFLALASTFMLWRILFTPTDSAVGGTQGVFHRRPALRPKGVSNRSAVILYIFLTAACLYTHYFTLFLLLFHNLAWLVWTLKNRGFLKNRTFVWLTSQVSVLLLFTPQLTLALRQVTSYTNPNLASPSLSEFISRSWQAYTVGLTIDPLPAQWGMAIIAGVLVLVLLSELIQASKNQAKSALYVSRFSAQPPFGTFHVLFLLGWFLIPLAAYFIVLQRQPSFEPRYLILVTPALFLLLAFSLGQGSGVRGQGSGVRGHASRFSAQPPLGTPHASRFTLHASRLTPHASRFIPRPPHHLPHKPPQLLHQRNLLQR